MSNALDELFKQLFEPYQEEKIIKRNSTSTSYIRVLKNGHIEYFINGKMVKYKTNEYSMDIKKDGSMVETTTSRLPHLVLKHESRTGDVLDNYTSPARVWEDNFGNVRKEEYYRSGKRHRECGPAILEYDKNGDVVKYEFFLNGKAYNSFKEYCNDLKKISPTQQVRDWIFIFIHRPNDIVKIQLNENQKIILDDIYNVGPIYLYLTYDDFNHIDDINELCYEFKFIQSALECVWLVGIDDNRRKISFNVLKYEITDIGARYIERMKKTQNWIR